MTAATARLPIAAANEKLRKKQNEVNKQKVKIQKRERQPQEFSCSALAHQVRP